MSGKIFGLEVEIEGYKFFTRIEEEGKEEELHYMLGIHCNTV